MDSISTGGRRLRKVLSVPTGGLEFVLVRLDIGSASEPEVNCALLHAGRVRSPTRSPNPAKVSAPTCIVSRYAADVVQYAADVVQYAATVAPTHGAVMQYAAGVIHNVADVIRYDAVVVQYAVSVMQYDADVSRYSGDVARAHGRNPRFSGGVRPTPAKIAHRPLTRPRRWESFA